jgi:hypothetical protein
MIDTFISAQLPDPTIDPMGFDTVSSFTVHGPCGPRVAYFPCVADGSCSKFYPKQFYEHTSILENGFAQYACPNNGIVVNKIGIDVDNMFIVPHNVDLVVKCQGNKIGIDVDNRFIVPHNVDLVVKCQAHINVERVNRDGMHKYLFKYVPKGFDSAKIGIQRVSSAASSFNDIVIEINDSLECCCVTPNDGGWRLL